MEMKITVQNWKVITKDDKTKTIGGEYCVKIGDSTVAKSSFNEGYNHTSINIPTELMVKVEALDAEIRQAIVNNFTV